MSDISIYAQTYLQKFQLKEQKDAIYPLLFKLLKTITQM